MIVTSKNPKHLQLGRDINLVTLRMGYFRKMLDTLRVCMALGVNILESLHEKNPDGKSVTPEGEHLEHVVQTKVILSNLHESLEASNTEFTKYVEEFEKLDKVFQRIQNQPKPPHVFLCKVRF